MRSIFFALGHAFPNLMSSLAFKRFTTPRKKRKRLDEPSIFEEAEREYLHHRGKQIATYKWGNKNRTVLLAHGWEGSAYNYWELIPILLEQGFTVIAVDAPAHGQSDGKRTDLYEYAEVLNKLIEHTGPPSAIIAHSGAGISVGILLSYLYKGPNIGKVVCMGSPAKLSYAIDNFVKYLGLPNKISKGMIRHIEKKYDSIDRFDLTQMGNIFCKRTQTLLIYDHRDKVVPLSDLYEIERSWGVSKSIRTSGVNHYKMPRHPNYLVSIALFLADIAPDKASKKIHSILSNGSNR